MLKKDVQGVHLVRAIASLMVMLTHYFGDVRVANVNYFYYGYLGVELFFVLSGYIIAHSLPPNYTLKNFKTFIFKRIVRIEPPYIASIFLLLFFNFLSYRITGYLDNPFHVSDLLFHFAYLNNFGFGTYYNHNYWTLGIEFQFYILLGLSLPFIKKNVSAIITFTIMLMLSLIKTYNGWETILPFLSMFGLGLILFFYQSRQEISKIVLVIFLALFTLQIYYIHGIEALIACYFALSVIAFWNLKNKIILFFSKISFSLYLIHTPIGTKVINLGLRFFDDPNGRKILILAEIVIAIFAAYLFYLLVERPSMRLAKKIVYD